jgi:hypothetical protein
MERSEVRDDLTEQRFSDEINAADAALADEYLWLIGGHKRFNGADKTKRLEQQFSDALGSLISEALETKRGHYGPLARAEVTRILQDHIRRMSEDEHSPQKQ